MKIDQQGWTQRHGWERCAGSPEPDAQLVLAFGRRSRIEQASLWTDLRARWPRAHIVGCSTAGEIVGATVRDDSLVATALRFERSHVQCCRVRLADVSDSHAAGKALVKGLERSGLRHVFVLSDGLAVNGSELVRGLIELLPQDVAVTGGLSADGTDFVRTRVGLDMLEDGACVVAVGLYGTTLRVGFGSLGGWDAFGPERVITRSRGAVLYELDGEPALALYKRYLGEHAGQLPASGLFFPLTVRRGIGERGVVRTILAVDEAEQSLTFAGDVPEGSYGQLMHANFDRLVDGASAAARTCQDALRGAWVDVAFLISCAGRKLVLQQRVEEEVEAVRDVLGEGTVLAGFYSYGELSPFTPTARCELHNQTMTITTLREA